MSHALYADLKTRLLSAIAMVAVAGVAMWQGPFLVAAMMSAVTALMCWEFRRMVTGLDDRAAPALWIMVVACCAGIVLAVWVAPLVGGAVIVAAIAALGLLERHHLHWTAPFTIYVILAAAVVVMLRGSAPTVLIWIALLVVAVDVGGYFAGRAFGGPKLWPAVSPKKTWSGTLGGWALALAVTAAMRPLGLGDGIGVYLLALVLSVAAQAGDLAESAVKRRFGVKDSSDLIPGHGGLLDRLDGHMAAFALYGLLMLARVV